MLTCIIFSSHEVCAHVSMCCIFQHADTDNNNLVNVCLCQEKPLACCIILRRDSGSQVEITGPTCLSGQHQVTCILKSLWLFCYRNLQQVLTSGQARGLWVVTLSRASQVKTVEISLIYCGGTAQMLRQVVPEINCYSGAKRSRCGHQILLDNIQD